MKFTKQKVTKATFGGREFLLNPSSFQDSLGTNWNETQGSGMNYPAYVYGGGKKRTISFEIYLNDAIKEGETQSFIAFLHSYLPRARSKGRQFHSPKTAVFSFGWFVKDVLLESMEIDYRKFSPSLEPIEASVEVTLIILEN